MGNNSDIPTADKTMSSDKSGSREERSFKKFDEKVFPDKSISTDEDGSGEEKYFKKFDNTDHEHAINFKEHRHRISICVLYLVYSSIAIMAFCLLYHLLTPESYDFMVKDNFVVVKNILIGTMLGGSFSQGIKKLI